jgi:hypothetical protein
VKIYIRAAKVQIGNRRFAIAVFHGERWWKLSSWTHYTLVGRLETTPGFHIGPLMFWDGS